MDAPKITYSDRIIPRMKVYRVSNTIDIAKLAPGDVPDITGMKPVTVHNADGQFNGFAVSEA